MELKLNEVKTLHVAGWDETKNAIAIDPEATYTYEVSDPLVLSIAHFGNDIDVTALAEGTAEIKLMVELTDGTKIYDSVTINVVKPEHKLTTVTLGE